MKQPTRQQRRKQTRQFNKKIKKEGNSLLGRKLLDDKSDFEAYTPSSQHPAVMPFCMIFKEQSDLNDFTFSCREGAESFQDNEQPKMIVLIREPHIELPAPKQEMMKIATRIFKKVAPSRTYIFVEAEGTQETADISGAIHGFLRRLGRVPEDTPPPAWLSEYIYQAENPNDLNT